MDVLARYSNRPDRPAAIAEVVKRLQSGEESAPAEPPTVAVAGQPAQTHGLSDDQVRDIFACYRNGTGPRELAGRHGVTERAIKYLLKKHGLQRIRGGGEPLGVRP